MSLELGSAWHGTFLSPEAELGAGLGIIAGILVARLTNRKKPLQWAVGCGIAGWLIGTGFGAFDYYGPGGAGNPYGPDFRG